jgi:hypothetical protein
MREPAQQALQQAHLNRLRSVSRYSGVVFTGHEHLGAEILRSFVIDLLVNAGLSKLPQTLPYASLSSLFKGRKALLNQIETSLGPIADQPGVAAPAVALVGQGGVGKSRLAIEWAWRQLGRHSALLFVVADSPEAIERNLAGLCGERGLDLPEKALTDSRPRACQKKTSKLNSPPSPRKTEFPAHPKPRLITSQSLATPRANSHNSSRCHPPPVFTPVRSAVAKTLHQGWIQPHL